MVGTCHQATGNPFFLVLFVRYISQQYSPCKIKCNLISCYFMIVLALHVEQSLFTDLFNHCFSYSCLSTFVIYMLLQGWNQCSPCMSRSSRGPCLVLVICFNSLWSKHMKFSNKPVYEVLVKTKDKKCKFLFCEVLYSASSIDLYICA